MIALITGATSGFGEAIARLLVANGYQVIITGRRRERLQKLQAELGKNVLPLCFDICDKEATITAINTLPEQWQPINLLVNNAGLALGAQAYPDCSLDDWQQMIDTNISGLVTITYAVLPQMIKQNSGHIINIGSVAGTYPYRGGNVYGATKAFVQQFSLNLRTDLHGTGIRVSNIEPGLCGETEFSKIRYHGDEQKAQQPYTDVNYIKPQDIAETVLWVNTCPAYMNINRIEIMPVAQVPGGLAVKKFL